MALCLSFFLAGPGLMEAQETPRPTLEEIGRAIKDLSPQVKEAARLAGAADRRRLDSIRAADQLPQDTVRVGPFEIVTTAGQGPFAREIFQPSVEELVPRIRGAEELFRTHTWAFHYGWLRRPVFADAPVVHEVRLSPRWSVDRLVERTRTSLAEALGRVLPEDAGGLDEWAEIRAFMPSDDWSGVYRELVSTPSLATRRCYEGDLGWCWEAVGLTSREGGGRDWYSPSERRRLVESRFSNWRSREGDRLGTGNLLVRGCLLLESDRACDLVLEGYGGRVVYLPQGYPIPFSRGARGSLVAEALRIGGEGSFTRLIENPRESIKNRLVYSSGVPTDTLMARWRLQALSGRTDAQAGLVRSPIALLFWLFLIIALATRSSRWRLG